MLLKVAVAAHVADDAAPDRACVFAGIVVICEESGVVAVVQESRFNDSRRDAGVIASIHPAGRAVGVHIPHSGYAAAPAIGHSMVEYLIIKYIAESLS